MDSLSVGMKMSNSYTIINVIKDAVTGKLQFASKDIARERLFVCKNCEAYDMFWKQCTVCGCFMPIKTKLANSDCPMNLWKEYD